MTDFKPGETVYVRATATGERQYEAELVKVKSCDMYASEYDFTLRAVPETVWRSRPAALSPEQQAVIEAAKAWRSIKLPNAVWWDSYDRNLVEAVDALEPPKPLTAEELIAADWTGLDALEAARLADDLRQAGLLK